MTSYAKIASVSGHSKNGEAAHINNVIESVEIGILKNIPDWSQSAVNGDHLWVSSSSEFCYAGDKCRRIGSKLKCTACNVTIHQSCISVLLKKLKFVCKPTFITGEVSQYREQTSIAHHWVYMRPKKGKCNQCGKSFNKSVVNCSWCKRAYHNKEFCFDQEANCDMGDLRNSIVPPSWIIKLPKIFMVKPIPSSNQCPIIVFINPKSGGNQGLKLLQKFQYLLNPRQVFDLTQAGPRFGLELFKKVANLRVLTCGGDGTVGWVLSTIDQVGIRPPPAVGVLPLGTGNDLARALGWGGGYTDEPIRKIIVNVSKSEVVWLDRWAVQVEPNPSAVLEEEGGKRNLPLNVVNNYFSLGVDAHIALEFHEAREARPEKFNSRLRNKMFYGQMGGKDLLKRKWKDLTDSVTLECDGEDLTAKLRALKVHALVFLNISSYGGGTRPWNKSDQSTEDGLIEVVGLTTYQLPMLQAGGHGTCISQCKSATITTTKTIPMQVDGEACKLNPSIIKISLLNKACMLARKRRSGSQRNQNFSESLSVSVSLIKLNDYELNHNDGQSLSQTALTVAQIDISPTFDLQKARELIALKFKSIAEWCFLDSCTEERFYRIDKAQENLHYALDVFCGDNLYILDCDPDDETSTSSPKSTCVLKEAEISSDNEIEYLQPGFENLRDFTSPDRILEKIITQESKEAFLIAAKRGDLKKIRQLNVRGSAFLVRDSGGQTSLHYASRYGFLDIVKFILSHAPPTIVHMKESKFGQTALHKAAAHKFRKICCVLIACGAFVDVIDSNGLTPKILALQSNDGELAAYLECQEYFQQISFGTTSKV